MIRERTLLIFLIISLHAISCEENLPPKVSVDFINLTGDMITILDNSGNGMFEKIEINPYESKNVRYECYGGGSCNIRFHHEFSGDYEVCLCFDGYQRNEKYTFGYNPINEMVSEEEKCNACRN